MELLDAMSEGGVLWIACKHSCLIQMLTTVLDAVDLDTDLHGRLFQVSVSSHTHRFCCSYLTTWSGKL